MPRYDYDCAACGRRFEVVLGVHDDGPTVCALCGRGPVKKAFSPPTIHFKGSGWAKKERHASNASRASRSPAADEATGEGPSPATGETAEGSGTDAAKPSGSTTDGSSKDGGKPDTAKSDGGKSDGPKSDRSASSSKADGPKSGPSTAKDTRSSGGSAAD